MPKKGGRRKKTRTHVNTPQSADEPTVPKSFVFKKGKVPTVVQELVQDMRRVMAPFTAQRLREKQTNSLQDFVRVAAPMGISHFAFFSSTDASTNLKIARIPRGPTLSFQVTAYSLMKHVAAMQKRPVDTSLAFRTSPLVVLNNFNSTEDHVKLMNVTFQSMFPPLDIQNIRLSECRRVVLFNYDKVKGVVDFRQYVIRATPVGVSRNVKQMVKARIPDLSNLDDISEFMLNGASVSGNASDSEVDDEYSHVSLPDTFHGRGNRKSERSAVRLTEIGPRMTLKLVKVEREICDGDVLYHAFVTKSAEEALAAKAKRVAADALRAQRKKTQEDNVQRKKDIKEAKKQAKVQRREARKEAYESTKDESDSDSVEEESDIEEDEVADAEIDDEEYYRREVGEEPEPDLFRKKPKADVKSKKRASASGKPTTAKFSKKRR